MAMKNSTSTPERADHPVTAPLSAPAVEALARLSEGLAPELTAARYEAVSAHCSDASIAGDIEECLRAQDEMRMCRCQLEQAGRLDLIGGGV